MQTSKGENIVSLWLIWHFYEMPAFLLGVWKNYILFALNYFSLLSLLKSLFAPWRRYRWNYPRGLDVGAWISTVISNFFSRIIGAIVRVMLIFVGAAFQLFVIFAGLIVFLLWIIIPFLVAAGIIFSFIY